VVGADLEGLVSSHHQTGLLVLLVLQQSHITGTTLLPLPGFAVELEKLRAHLEDLLLKFLVGLDVDLLGQVDDRLKVDFGGFRGLILLKTQLEREK
jgi:hypothetical protein